MSEVILFMASLFASVKRSTVDSDEDYNAVILGPVYPALMPQFEGIVKP
jgi:hypothetical protein